ncbi:MAG: hypothetical protein U0L18_01530 [Acutalibacteraceae bacterium]|nr:hypothetical protein [Acutalibacteraceae bacterium]
MSENGELKFVFQEISNQEFKPKDFVEKCVESSSEESTELLALYTKSIEKSIKSISYESLKKITSIVYRGLKFKSEQAGALKYFYFGYYLKNQENILKQANEYYQRIKIEEIKSKKHCDSIMEYLLINGISRQKDISSDLNIDKSNLSRILNEMSEYKLVNKIEGPKANFYELTVNGYKYCKSHSFNSGSTIKKIIVLDSDRLLSYHKSQISTKGDNYGIDDVKLMLSDGIPGHKAKFELKKPFTEDVDLVESDRYNMLLKNKFECK